MAAFTAATPQALVIGHDSSSHWTPDTVVLSIFLFFLAGLCEIGGGWLVWQVSSSEGCTASTADPSHLHACVIFATCFQMPACLHQQQQLGSTVPLCQAQVCCACAQAVREGKARWWGALGCLVLVTYGFVPTAQPVSVFGRIYAGKAS